MRALAVLLVLATGLTFSTAAFADPPPSTPPAAAPAPNPNEIICRDRMATGSRLAYARDCHTRAEWDFITRTSRDFVNGIQQRSLDLNNPPGGAGGGH